MLPNQSAPVARPKTRNKSRPDKGALILRNGALSSRICRSLFSHSSAIANARLVSVVCTEVVAALAFDALSIRRISLWLRGQRRSALCYYRSTTRRRRLAAVCTTTCCFRHLLAVYPLSCIRLYLFTLHRYIQSNESHRNPVLYL